MLAVTTGESRSEKEIPRAARLTFFLLAGLYLGAIIVLVGVMPWNHAGASESPFVTVLSSAKIPAAAAFMNFVVLTAALSGANAKLYVASRLLFSMGRNGWAPASMGKLNASGSPRLALLVSSYGIVTALIIENWAPQQAFLYIMGAAFFGLILSWVISLAAHISFRLRLTSRATCRATYEIPLRHLRIRAWLRTGLPRRSPHSFLISHQRNQRTHLLPCVDGLLSPSETRPEARQDRVREALQFQLPT